MFTVIIYSKKYIQKSIVQFSIFSSQFYGNFESMKHYNFKTQKLLVFKTKTEKKTPTNL